MSKMPADLVPSESSLPGLQMASFLQCFQMVERMSSLLSPLIGTLILLSQASTIMISFNLITSLL